MMILMFCRDDYVRIKWDELMGKLEQRKFTLDGFNSLMAMLREIESIQEELKEVEVNIETSSCEH